MPHRAVPAGRPFGLADKPLVSIFSNAILLRWSTAATASDPTREAPPAWPPRQSHGAVSPQGCGHIKRRGCGGQPVNSSQRQMRNAERAEKVVCRHRCLPRSREPALVSSACSACLICFCDKFASRRPHLRRGCGPLSRRQGVSHRLMSNAKRDRTAEPHAPEAVARPGCPPSRPVRNETMARLARDRSGR